ncbi:MAG: NAD(P)H-dependent oxidoreductase [Leptospirales bacterium]|nr:NAD(P)H-dependent oxidoreductase [Leptospirales bacterium]
MIKILGISGSLRARSKNSALLRLIQERSAGVEVTIFHRMGSMPLFNPDVEFGPFEAVLEFRKQIRAADAVIIASPEYAHGVTGVMKNALDWIVGSGELVNKPVAVLNAAPASTHANLALLETLRVMNVPVIPGASLAMPVSRGELDEEKMRNDVTLGDLIDRCVRELAHAVERAEQKRLADLAIG